MGLSLGEAKTISMNALVTKVSDAINNAIASDQLVLPTMPEIALQVREVAEDRGSNIKQLAAIIGTDVALTARIIKVANSAMFRRAKQTEDLNMALSRLGMMTTATLATGLAMEQMFQATTDIVDKRLRQVWARSTEIAGMSAVLCKHCTTLRPEQAALAGLTHQIGVLPILVYAENNPTLLKDSITLDIVIRATHPQIGAQILSTWEFPKEIQQVPLHYANFTRQSDQVDYSDIVTVAMLQASPERFSDLDFTTVTAFERLKLDPAIDRAEGEGLSEELAQAVHLLG